MTPGSTSFVKSLLDEPSRSFAVKLWNGEVLRPRAKGPAGRIVLRDSQIPQLFVPPVSEREIAEAFIEGRIDFEGDGIGLLEAAARWTGPRIRLAQLGSAVKVWLRRMKHRTATHQRPRRRGRLHSMRRDSRAVRRHYDLSDNFYRLFLDPEMLYSCAYFPHGDESLEAAQRAKLDLICAKLDLRPGDRFLDVGCGWGALVTFAARHYGVSALGVTVSKNQAAEALRRRAAMPEAPVEIRLCDYRRLEGEQSFDKIASIGMMEHVGRKCLDRYFAALFRVLRPGGLLLNSAIADTMGTNTLPWASRRGGGFIDRYIFPDGELLPLDEIIGAAERAGYEVRDVESLREHYARTVSIWLSRLEENRDRAVSVVGRRRTRAFRLYLMCSAAAFRLGRIGVFHLLLAKRQSDGRACGLPASRAAWYSADGINGVAASVRNPVRSVVVA